MIELLETPVVMQMELGQQDLLVYPIAPGLRMRICANEFLEMDLDAKDFNYGAKRLGCSFLIFGIVIRFSATEYGDNKKPKLERLDA